MVWPIVKVLTQVFGSVVAEAGNKEIFRREVNKAWRRQVEGRFERSRLRKAFYKDPMPANLKGTDADAAPFNEAGERLRSWYQQQRKDGNTMASPSLTSDPKKRPMHPAEAVKVLHLSEASQEEIEKRFTFLMGANGDKGASQYVHDKISHARDIALDQLSKGTLNRHFKAKPQTSTPEEPKL